MNCIEKYDQLIANSNKFNVYYNNMHNKVIKYCFTELVNEKLVFVNKELKEIDAFEKNVVKAIEKSKYKQLLPTKIQIPAYPVSQLETFIKVLKVSGTIFFGSLIATPLLSLTLLGAATGFPACGIAAAISVTTALKIIKGFGLFAMLLNLFAIPAYFYSQSIVSEQVGLQTAKDPAYIQFIQNYAPDANGCQLLDTELQRIYHEFSSRVSATYDKLTPILSKLNEPFLP